jgi:hypothetical protein
MLRTTLLAATALVLCTSNAWARFDAATGTVALDDAALAIGFEAPDDTAQNITFEDQAAPTLSEGVPKEWNVAGGIERDHALRIPTGRGVILGTFASLASLQDARVELRFWARADGVPPSGRLLYGTKDITTNELTWPNAAIEAIETGNATSDGWVEYSTGPVDAVIGKSRLAGIVFKAEASLVSTAGFIVDGVALLRAGPLPGRSLTCTLAQEDSVCGADGACLGGKCVDSALVYGALPTLEQRRDIVARQEQYTLRFAGDRYGATRGVTTFSPAARAAADTATTARTFWQPFLRAAAMTRAPHAQATYPQLLHGASWFAATYRRSEWNELLACFGMVDRDLSGSGRGFAVFQAAPTSPVHVGDLVEEIDGEDPRTWLARAVPIAPLSSDPDADDAEAGAVLQQVVPALARTIVVTRCASATSCSGTSAQKITIDVDAQRKNASAIPSSTQPLCSVRFKRGVDIPNGADPEAYEAAFESVDADGIVNVLTNGEPPGNSLATVVNQAFDRSASKMIVDKRRGDGGGGASLSVWAERVRRDPSFRLFSEARWSYDALDPPASLFAALSACDSDNSQEPICWASGASWMGIAASGTARPAKIAWLNEVDGSASDFATAYAKGTPGVRIFAPNRTMGLFGSLYHLPSFGHGLADAYAQRVDTRIGTTWDEVTSAVWHSGRGIDPDEVIVQKHSDVLRGVDTMLDRARAWLKAN